MDITLKDFNAAVTINEPFEHSTNGAKADFDTLVKLRRDADFLKIEFVCADNPHTDFNTMHEHNAPLYNQEVFEVFIAAGIDDPKKYWEIEINPNNAVWIGEISNPGLGDGPQSIIRQLLPQEAGILFGVEKKTNQWEGFLNIPWELIGLSKQYRLNFYRIRARKANLNPDWICDTENCDFVCWKSTMSGEDPAFHKPKKFGVLNLV